jgi:probable F420-dependent oxidoreductase
MRESSLRGAGAGARALEEAGFDGGYVVEGTVDPFLSLGAAASTTSRLTLVSGVAIALARSPMTTALQAWNIQDLSEGRLVLGLGSQIKTHVEKRYSMPWGAPAAQMREYILALRAIWDCWGRGAPLEFRGTYYTHSLMIPTFNPGPIEHPDPLVMMGGLGPRMVAVAGEVADGYYGHPFASADFIRTVQVPALEVGKERRSPSLSEDVAVSMMPMVVTGRSPDERATAEQTVRKLCAFYGSTPAYYRVLEHHGYTELGPRLNAMSKRGEWDAMAELIDDDLLGELAIVGTPAEIPGSVRDRCVGLADRVAIYAPYKSDLTMWREILSELRGTDRSGDDLTGTRSGAAHR